MKCVISCLSFMLWWKRLTFCLLHATHVKTNNVQADNKHEFSLDEYNSCPRTVLTASIRYLTTQPVALSSSSPPECRSLSADSDLWSLVDADLWTSPPGDKSMPRYDGDIFWQASSFSVQLLTVCPVQSQCGCFSPSSGAQSCSGSALNETLSPPGVQTGYPTLAAHSWKVQKQTLMVEKLLRHVKETR